MCDLFRRAAYFHAITKINLPAAGSGRGCEQHTGHFTSRHYIKKKKKTRTTLSSRTFGSLNKLVSPRWYAAAVGSASRYIFPERHQFVPLPAGHKVLSSNKSIKQNGQTKREKKMFVSLTFQARPLGAIIRNPLSRNPVHGSFSINVIYMGFPLCIFTQLPLSQ